MMSPVQSEGMESLYEDLSLFNGDLLLEDVEFSPAAPLKTAVQDGLLVTMAPLCEDATPFITKEVLQHPQSGSQEFGLVDLLATSPTSDLPDPLSTQSAWMDQNADLMNLTADSQPQPTKSVSLKIPTIEVSFPDSPEAAVVPGTPENQTPSANIVSLEEIQKLLFMDLHETVPTTHATESQAEVSMDLLGELVEAGMDELLDASDIIMDESGTSLLEAPILSPVSANDVESILLSSPPSPLDTSGGSCSSSAQLLYGMSVSEPVSDTDQTNDPDYGPQRSTKRRSAQRSAPYTKSSQKSNGPVDRKERKKEQNRSAAIRYREKKRSETGVIGSEVEQLQKRNTELKDKVDSMTREITYLKDLMAAVLKAKKQQKKSSP